MTEELRVEIQRRIDALAVGSHFQLKVLLADIWFELGDGDARVDIAKAFSREVKSKEIRRCSRYGLKGSDRDTYYERIA